MLRATNSLHPFVPRAQAAGYTELTERLEKWLAEITGFTAVSVYPAWEGIPLYDLDEWVVYVARR